VPVDTSVFRGLIQGAGYREISLASLASGATYTVSVEEAKYSFLKFTGTVTGAVTVLFPAVVGLGWHVWNAVTHTDSSGQILLQVGATSIPLVDGVIQTLVVDETPAPRPVGVAPANPSSVSGPVGVLLGSPMPPSWVRIDIGAATSAMTLTESQASAQFIEFHNAHNGLVAVTFPVVPGHVWFARCASDSVFAVNCKSATDTGAGVDINPGYDGILMIDSTGNLTNGALVKHGNTHAGAGTDPITTALASTALGSGAADGSKFLRGDQSWQPLRVPIGTWTIPDVSALTGTDAEIANTLLAAARSFFPIAPGTANIWQLRLSADIGGVGDSLTFTVYKNGSASPLTRTYPGGAGTEIGENGSGGAVTWIADTDAITMFAKKAGAPAAVTAHITIWGYWTG
jgi:hypothetical protein